MFSETRKPAFHVFQLLLRCFLFQIHKAAKLVTATWRWCYSHHWNTTCLESIVKGKLSEVDKV
jgi:hypothetical protein